MNPFSKEELKLFGAALEEVLPEGARYFLIVVSEDRCGAIGNTPPECADEIKAVMAELSQREIQFET